MTAGTTHTCNASPWRRAVLALGVKGNEETSATAAPPVPLKTHRCYKIPEDETAGTGVGPEEATNRAQASCAWRCPLTAKKCELPSNARLVNNILGVGAAPDMKSCRGCKQKRNWGAAANSATHTGRAEPAPHCDAAPKQHAPPLNALQAGETQCTGPEAGAAMAQAEGHAQVCETAAELGTKAAAILPPRSQPPGTHAAVHADCLGSRGQPESPAHSRDGGGRTGA